jgi:hypothetical protein
MNPTRLGGSPPPERPPAQLPGSTADNKPAEGGPGASESAGAGAPPPSVPAPVDLLTQFYRELGAEDIEAER